MRVVNVEDAVIGQIISEPVISPSGVLICNPGTPISRTLKRSLPNFGIHKVQIKAIIGDQFDEECLNFSSLTNMTYMSLKRLDTTDISKCANVMVDNLAKSEECLMLNMLFNYDDVTYNHSLNVASLALTCGIKLGLTVRELYLLSYGCLVHDIGKSRISLDILNKNGKLTDEEFDIIKTHPQLGYNILDELDQEVPTAVKQIVLQHHENHDGTGYPNQLKDYHIYKLARLAHIADCYEALCAKRPYKDALPRLTVREFMTNETGSKFDPIMLRKFLNIIPLYLVGEEIEYNGVTGVIIDTADGKNPLVSVGKDIIRLSDFQTELYTRNKIYEECRERLVV